MNRPSGYARVYSREIFAGEAWGYTGGFETLDKAGKPHNLPCWSPVARLGSRYGLNRQLPPDDIQQAWIDGAVTRMIVRGSWGAQ